MRSYDGHDMLAARFQGFIIGLIAACAILASHGCWRGEVVRDVPVVEWRTAHVSRLDCHKLTALVGKVPHEPLFIECASIDPADYFECRADQYRRWAEALHAWVGMAIAECAE